MRASGGGKGREPFSERAGRTCILISGGSGSRRSMSARIRPSQSCGVNFQTPVCIGLISMCEST